MIIYKEEGRQFAWHFKDARYQAWLSIHYTDAINSEDLYCTLVPSQPITFTMFKQLMAELKLIRLSVI